MPAAHVAAEVDFARDIRPILSDHCFHCHGPDEESRGADLRLDVKEAMFAPNKDGVTAVHPGNLEKSELWYRITTDDEDDIMPPPKSPKPALNKRQQALIKDWIESGAKWAEHWSFAVPQKEEAPANSHPIDHFVRKHLKGQGLSLSPQADPTTLARRLHLDLTGLPPKPSLVRAFLASWEKDPDKAYDKLLDELLANRHFGERMALMWLDAARYGDTSVMHADGPRTMWPWRDWVVDAYNNNKPFDEFSIEQLAGDLIPEATLQQKVASGFNRNHATSDEGGAIAEELRVQYVVDRVQTTANVWMGLTMECGQCHEHKYDPISQEEYYHFYAFFNNHTDPGMQTRRGNQNPVIEVVSEEQQKKKAVAQEKVDAITKKLDDRKKAARGDFDIWADEQFLEIASGEEKEPIEPAGLVAHLPLDSFEKNLTKDLVRKKGQNRLHGKAKAQKEGKFGGSVKIEGNGFVEVKDFGDFEWNRPFSFGCWLKTDKGNLGGGIFSKMDESNSFRGYDLWIQNGQPGTHIVHKWQDNAVKIVGKKKINPKEWNHIFVTYNGTGKAAGTAVYLNGERLDHNVEADGLNATIITDKPVRIGRRYAGSQVNGAEIDDVRFYDRELSAEEVKALNGSDPIGPLLAIAAAERTPEQTNTLLEHYLRNLDKPYKKLVEDRRKADAEVAKLQKTKVTTMIMADFPANKMRKTYLLNRGAYDQPKKEKEFEPNVPAILPPLPKDSPKNRLTLAKWLFSDDHPLTSRVAVNHIWQLFFGHGIVQTPRDFGAQGSFPTHPELMDWLAVDFRDNGWDVKRLVRQILTSDTYKQTSNATQELLAKDPSNNLLARATRFRLQAEFIRDSALYTSGLLRTDLTGGPGVKPFQPKGLWAEVGLGGNPKFKQDTGDKLYRRSIYSYWKRSAPPPNMVIFDAPTREVCTVKRPRTNTPLQALVTMNDPQFVEASRFLAERMMKEAGEKPADRASHGFELVTLRKPSQKELSALLQVHKTGLASYMESKEDAQALLKIGDAPADTSLPTEQHAAWTLVANLLLNLDETITRE